MRNKIFIAAVSLSVIAVSGQSKKITIDEAVGIALKNNSSVISARQTRRIYEEKVRQYWAGVFPKIDVNSSYTRNMEKSAFMMGGQKIEIGKDNQYDLALELSQILWAGGKVATAIQIAGIYQKSAQAEERITKNLTAQAVRSIYYDALLAKQTADIQRDTFLISKQHLARLKTRYAKGLESNLRVLRQEVETSSLEPALIKAKNIYNLGLLSLNNLLGLDPENEIEIVPPAGGTEIPAKKIDELYREALESRPEARTAKYAYEMAQKTVKVEKGEYYPEVKFVAARNYTGQSDSGFPSSDESVWSSTAGVKLSLNIFAGGETKSRVKQAEYAVERAFQNYEAVKRNTKIEVKKAWLDYREAAERIKSQEKSIEQAKEVLSATEERFKQGLASQLELNDALLALNGARLALASAEHDKFIAWTDMQWAIGRSEQ